MEKIKLQPSKIYKKFSYKGYSCVITKTWMGIHCGYVGITNLTPKYYKNYELCDEIKCHGGITWQGKTVSKNKSKKGNEFHWIGFDCGHYNDYIPEMYKNISSSYVDNLPFRDVNYCIKECKNIVNQLLTPLIHE